MASVTQIKSDSDRHNGERHSHNTLVAAGLSVAKWGLGLVVGLGGGVAVLEGARQTEHTPRASLRVSGINIDPENNLVRIATPEGETIAPVDSVTALPLKPGDQARYEKVEVTSALPTWAVGLVPSALSELTAPRLEGTEYVLYLTEQEREQINGLKPPAEPEEVLNDPMKHLGKKITFQIPAGLESQGWYGVSINGQIFKVETFSNQFGLSKITILSPVNDQFQPQPGHTVTGCFERVPSGSSGSVVAFHVKAIE